MKLKLTAILIFILTYGLFLYVNSKTKNERINLALEKQINILDTHYLLTENYFITDAKSIQNKVITNNKILNLFSKAQNTNKIEKKIIRDELYKFLKPMYKRIHSRGILQFQFVFPNNISFLRMHKPNKFGDDLTDVRYSFRHVNKTKEVVKGFEQGKTTHAFRYVFPIFDKNNKHLGAVEISLASYALQDKLLNVNKIHSHFLVDKNIFNVKAWEDKYLKEKYTQSIEHHDYMFALSNHSNLSKLRDSELNIVKPIKKQIINNISLKKSFALYVPTNDNVKVITFLPIRNTQNKKVVAYLVSYTNNANIHNILANYTSTNIAIFISFLFLFYFIYQNLNSKNELEILVKAKTQDLKELNKNLANKIKDEVSKNHQIQEQLFKSEKMASMGEMIGNIAHQWRQPLSVISTSATGMEMQKEYGILTDEQFKKSCSAINDNAQYLSKTIDDFKNYIKGDRVKTKFYIKKDINDFLRLVEGAIKSNQIELILDLENELEINGYENELIQCFINIFNNAKDILKEIGQDDRLLFITTKKLENKVVIKFKDSGGGVPEDIINKIFDPYFTTKHKSQGTGLGLHMTYDLIVNGMDGDIIVNNKTYKYNKKEYTGAEFTITLNID